MCVAATLIITQEVISRAINSARSVFLARKVYVVDTFLIIFRGRSKFHITRGSVKQHSLLARGRFIYKKGSSAVEKRGRKPPRMLRLHLLFIRADASRSNSGFLSRSRRIGRRSGRSIVRRANCHSERYEQLIAQRSPRGASRTGRISRSRAKSDLEHNRRGPKKVPETDPR